MASYCADDALVVTNPEVSSVRDSDRILGILSAKSRRAEKGEEPSKEYLLLTRHNPKRVAEGEMLSLKDIEDILRIKLIGVDHDSATVLQAANKGIPAIHLRVIDVAVAKQDVVARYWVKEKHRR